MTTLNVNKMNMPKQNSLRGSIENMNGGINQNQNKSLTNINEDIREFGKDLTNVSNLTITNQENINPNNCRRASEGLKEITNKIIAPGKPSRGSVHQSLKDDISQKLKNYKVRNGNSKTVHEVIQNIRKNSANLNISNSITIEPSVLAVLNPPLPQISNVIVNNDIITGECLNSKSDPAVEMDCAMNIDNDNVVMSDPAIAPQLLQNPHPQQCEEYINEIFSHLKEIQFMYLPSSTYMKNQSDINEKMRGILIDWLVEVHLKFKLLPETLFLTVNLLDRYLEKKVIMRNKLQLVGVSSMLIACKYEEIYAPEVRDFVYITDKAYTKEEILKMECEILGTLEYNLTVPSSFRYLEIFNAFLQLEESWFMFERYLLELILVDYKMLKYNPSLAAASTIFITLKISKRHGFDQVYELTGYGEDQLKECSKDICVILENVEKSQFQAVRKKFSLPKFLEVAKTKFI